MMRPYSYDRSGAGESAPDSGNNGTTVLLVDDDVSVRALVEATLESQGYHLLKAFDSDQALRLSDAHEGPIHLLIADQVMPPFMSGNELASCLRLMRPEIKVLYISGYEANDNVQDEVGDASADFLPKPFSPATLIGKVERLLSGPSADKESAATGESDEDGSFLDEFPAA